MAVQSQIKLLLTSLFLLQVFSGHRANAFVAPSRVVPIRRSLRDRNCELFARTPPPPLPPRFQGNGNDDNIDKSSATSNKNDVTTRQLFLKQSLFTTSATVAIATSTLSMLPQQAFSKCTDIESCREIGERKVEQDMIDNPTIRLESGARYKVLQPGFSSSGDTVQPDSNIDMIFSISTLSGGYMYSRGFGFEKIAIGDNKLQSDAGLDSLRVQLGQRDVPLGIEDALVGMKKGERRRVELPPRVGFETSQWKPEPTTNRGKARIVGYRQLIEGNGSTRPPFPAATIWDIEVLRIRK